MSLLRVFFRTAALLIAGGGGALHATLSPPSWYGEPGTTRQEFYFDTDSQSASANVLENPCGDSIVTVTLGPYSTGWQDPDNEFDFNRSGGDGAWDLGMGGYLSVDVPFAASPAGGGDWYRVDFHVEAVAYDAGAFAVLPGFHGEGHTARDLAVSKVLVEDVPPLASWEGLTWTGYYDHVTSNEVGFRVQAPANNVSVVDNLEVFTRFTIVPEPSSATLLVVILTMGAAQQRRRA